MLCSSPDWFFFSYHISVLVTMTDDVTLGRFEFDCPAPSRPGFPLKKTCVGVCLCPRSPCQYLESARRDKQLLALFSPRTAWHSTAAAVEGAVREGAAGGVFI